MALIKLVDRTVREMTYCTSASILISRLILRMIDRPRRVCTLVGVCTVDYDT